MPRSEPIAPQLRASGAERGSKQNVSDAVMAQRGTSTNDLDDFPTPPWATRALCEYLLPGKLDECLEPAAGRGYMAATLEEYFTRVAAHDIEDYSYISLKHRACIDFLNHPWHAGTYDWVITNPPFKLGEQFINKALPIARRGVAMLTRLMFIDTIGRHNRLWTVNPPTTVAQFAERVPMVEGRVDEKASTATAYCWLIWDKESTNPISTWDGLPRSDLVWIPPCRGRLEYESDYATLPINWPVRGLRHETRIGPSSRVKH